MLIQVDFLEILFSVTMLSISPSNHQVEMYVEPFVMSLRNLTALQWLFLIMETQFADREFSRYFNIKEPCLNEIFSSKIEWTTGKQYTTGELIASLTST